MFGALSKVLLVIPVLSLCHFYPNSDQERPQLPLGNSETESPNVVIFLTDDQDVRLDSLLYQPLVKKHLTDEGLTFQHHFCTVAICCPSRVNLWTGLAAHNTNVTDVNPPYGGYPKFVSQGFNANYLPVWLQNAGINTYYTGKLFNAHTIDNYNAPYPAGFTESDFLLDPYTYQYLNSTWQRNKERPKSYPGKYTTDIISEKANNFLNSAVAAQRPFFLAIAPVAPHSNVEFDLGSELSLRVTPPVSAERHKHLFDNVRVPRTDNFNPTTPSGANWIRRLTQQNNSQVEYNDEFYRSRLRALQAVDELVEGVVELLDTHNVLDNTYIIYTADNGYHIGQHRLPPGKECGYDEDINVPLIIRGPGVPKGAVTDQVTSHTDLAPTILNLFGLEPRDDFDGAAVALSNHEIRTPGKTRQEHVNVEYWGLAFAEGKYGFRKDNGAPEAAILGNNTYKAIRLISKQYNLYYSVWCNNEHELYDLTVSDLTFLPYSHRGHNYLRGTLQKDPYQLHNIHPSSRATDLNFPLTAPPTILKLPLLKVIHRLDALLLVLKSCKGASCTRPWDVLHPSGDVQNLEDALRPKFDLFYEKEQAKVEFSRCEPGYILDAEGPQKALVYRDGLPWNAWT